MRSADRIAAAALLVLAVAFTAGALMRYAYWSRFEGPGPGFMPFWVGLAMALLAAGLLVRAWRQESAGEPWAPRGEALRNVLVVLGASVGFVALMKVLGMVLAAALFLAVLVRYLERSPWRVTLPVAAGAAGAIWLVFAYWLRVPFPAGPLGF